MNRINLQEFAWLLITRFYLTPMNPSVVDNNMIPASSVNPAKKYMYAVSVISNAVAMMLNFCKKKNTPQITPITPKINAIGSCLFPALAINPVISNLLMKCYLKVTFDIHD